MRQLSNYPPGMTTGYQGESSADFKCPNCNHEWKVEGFNELGGWFPHNDDDCFCPKCGAEGE